MVYEWKTPIPISLSLTLYTLWILNCYHADICCLFFHCVINMISMLTLASKLCLSTAPQSWYPVWRLLFTLFIYLFSWRGKVIYSSGLWLCTTAFQRTTCHPCVQAQIFTRAIQRPCMQDVTLSLNGPSYPLKAQCHSSSIWWISFILFAVFLHTTLPRRISNCVTSFQPQHRCLWAPYLPISVSFIGALQIQILCNNCLLLSLAPLCPSLCDESTCSHAIFQYHFQFFSRFSFISFFCWPPLLSPLLTYIDSLSLSRSFCCS